MPNTSRGLSPIIIACHDMFTGLLSVLLFNLYKLALSFDSTENEKANSRRPITYSHIFIGTKEVLGRATLECMDERSTQSYDRSMTSLSRTRRIHTLML